MSQCVPSWDLDDSPPARLPLRSSRTHSIAPHDVPALLDYEVAELTWEKGQIAMHGLGPRRIPNKPLTNTTSTSANTTTNSPACKYAALATIPTAPSAWDKPHAGGTLESIVNHATRSSFPHKSSSSSATAATDELVPWFDRHSVAVATAAMATNNMDAQVPCSNRLYPQNDVASRRPAAGGVNVGSFTQLASCSGAAKRDDINNAAAQQMKLAGAPAARVSQEWSVSGTRGSKQMRMDDQYSCERDFGVAFTSTSLGSPENASSGKPSTKAATAAATATAADDHDSVCHSRLQASDWKKGEESV